MKLLSELTRNFWEGFISFYTFIYKEIPGSGFDSRDFLADPSLIPDYQLPFLSSAANLKMVNK